MASRVATHHARAVAWSVPFPFVAATLPDPAAELGDPGQPIINMSRLSRDAISRVAVPVRRARAGRHDCRDAPGLRSMAGWIDGFSRRACLAAYQHHQCGRSRRRMTVTAALKPPEAVRQDMLNRVGSLVAKHRRAARPRKGSRGRAIPVQSGCLIEQTSSRKSRRSTVSA